MRLRVTGPPIFFAAFLVILSGSYAGGATRQANPGQQTAGSTGDEQSTLRFNADTTLVLIPATVTDPLNRFVLGLQKQDFHLIEDRAEQTIAHFSGEDAPLSLGLVFDTSGSMPPRLLAWWRYQPLVWGADGRVTWETAFRRVMLLSVRASDK